MDPNANRTAQTPPAAPDKAEDAAPETPVLTPEATSVMAKVFMGSDFTDTFTLKQAVDAWNGTRQAVLHPDTGEVLLPVERQQMRFSDEWYAEHAGTFKVRQPGFYDELQLQVRYEQLSQGTLVRSSLAALLEGTAIAEIMLEEKPDWFNLTTIKDRSVILLIQFWYTRWSDRFREGL
jgi:hypothetical protein